VNPRYAIQRMTWKLLKILLEHVARETTYSAIGLWKYEV
jgi:hypothetical protein